MTIYKKGTDGNFIVFTWNIGGPSLERARKQYEWLKEQPADVFVLTECKRSDGCLFLERSFEGRTVERFLQDVGYHVAFPKPSGNEYGVLIASKHKLTPSTLSDRVDYLRPRVNSVTVSYGSERIEVIGLYLPSRGFDIEKRWEKKKRFVDGFLQALEETPIPPRRILCGDYNVLEPDHKPHYPDFEDWEYGFYLALRKYQLRDAFRHMHPTAQEYSWFGLSGNPYRYDHCFMSSNLIPLVDRCYYSHEPRELGLSDHSALVTILTI